MLALAAVEAIESGKRLPPIRSSGSLLVGWS
jgi:hypothetical protein